MSTSSSSSLVRFRASSSALIPMSSSTSLISSQLFAQHAGTAIATELLYRILIDIINRVLGSFQRLAAKGIEECSSFLERKVQERRDRLAAAKEQAGSLNIVKEVGKLAEEQGFITCPMTGQKMDLRAEGRMGPPGPPMWVRGVLEGIGEGRMHERDFWIQTHEG